MIFAVLPAYNESLALPLLLEEYCELSPQLSEPLRVVVVDDGSTDSTVQTAQTFSERLKLVILEHKVNRGLGAAFLTGFSYVAQAGKTSDSVVTMDADNTHSPRYIPEMLASLNNSDIVIASRYASGGKETGVPFLRSLLSHGASLLYSRLIGIPQVRDYTCGYRVYRLGIIQQGIEKYGSEFIQEPGFCSTGEILVKLAPLTESISEVGFELRYDLKGGMSKMPKVKTVLRTLQLLRKLRRISRTLKVE